MSNPHLSCEAGSTEASGLGAGAQSSQQSPILSLQLDAFVKVPW